MHIRLQILVVVTLALTIFTGSTYGGCSCGASSTTGVCGCQERIPRPYPRPKPVDPKLLPIGDTCSCGHTIVQPAVPPKPLCSSISLEPPQQLGCQEKTMRAPESYQGPHVNPNLVYGSKHKPEYKPLPADAVSLSLAYQLARSLRRPVPEDKLQYGFRVQPLNGVVKKIKANVPEERLLGLNRAIVELKAAAISEHHEDDDDDIEAAQQEARSPGYLTYGDIGYCPEKYPSKTFNIRVPSLPLDSLCADLPAKPDPLCGYRPGKITINEPEHDRYGHGIEDCLEGNP